MRSVITPLALAAALTVAAPAVAHADGPVDVLSIRVTKPLPAGVKAKGKTIEQVWTWGDADAAHTPSLAVFSSTDTSSSDTSSSGTLDDEPKTFRHRKIYVQYFRQLRGKWRELRMIQDGERDCEYDLEVQFLPGSVQVTDADGDGQAELSFLYDRLCASDVSPATRKLLVLEGKAKHALRGTSRVDVGDRFEGGAYKPDGFKKKRALQVMAEQRWAEFLAK
ncbi:MAG: hypothetical protein R3B06_00700 [Kofleriaceae bacterium]